jgi:hypothetical protein
MVTNPCHHTWSRTSCRNDRFPSGPRSDVKTSGPGRPSVRLRASAQAGQLVANCTALLTCPSRSQIQTIRLRSRFGRSHRGWGRAACDPAVARGLRERGGDVSAAWVPRFDVRDPRRWPNSFLRSAGGSRAMGLAGGTLLPPVLAVCPVVVSAAGCSTPTVASVVSGPTSLYRPVAAIRPVSGPMTLWERIPSLHSSQVLYPCQARSRPVPPGDRPAAATTC